MEARNEDSNICYLFSLNLLLGGSIGGIETGVLSDVLVGCITVVVVVVELVRTDTEGLPADVERTAGV